MGFFSLRCLVLGPLTLGFGSQLRADPVQPMQVILNWEGRTIEDPNVEALEKLRASQPELRVTHLINPSYFLDREGVDQNRAQLLRIVKPDDQVGLYLSSIENLMNEAGVVMRYQPTFWGHSDEQEVCLKDCGIDVPLAGRNREDLLKIFASAARSLQAAGFQGATSFAMRGGLVSPVLRDLARSFAYQHDLTLMDPQLLPRKLRSYPFFAWNNEQWLDRSRSAQPASAAFVLNGGDLDYNDANEVLERFTKFFQKAAAPIVETFHVALSQETAYYSAPRLTRILKGLEEQVSQKSMKIQFQTPSDLKNGRPASENRHISEL